MYDVIVAGAGPAGSTCARACARQGLRTLLLDKVFFPRQKPCGGAVSMQALSFLDFPLPDSLIEQECYGARVHYNGRSTEVRKQHPIALLVDRALFDKYLTDQAVASGARFVEGEKVVDVGERGAGLSVRTERNSHEARYLVGADGVHSRVARFVRPPLRTDETVLASVCQVKNDAGPIDKRLKNNIALYFGIAPMGYGWLFPHGGYYSLGIAGLASRLYEPRKALAAFGQSLQVEPGAIQARFIPLGGIKRRIAAERILLAGDAAGFADPLHGEGIAYAVLSGKLAAAAVVDGIRSGREPADTASRYTLECETRIRKQLRVGFYLARLLDRFPGLLIRIFLDNRTAIDRYLDIPAGRSDYRHFAQWLAARAPFFLFSSFLRGFSRQSEINRIPG